MKPQYWESQRKEKRLSSRLFGSFFDKNKYARKKIRGRMFSYEFNRVSPELQGAIDDAVKAVLAKHL
ncbi:ParB family protein [Serratia marcescens]|uniref:ParB family protein n=1 Tax=Serratia marcescens TaxID=615 RepID=UPI0020790DD7|nr:ParB family protein [Serratia marcescens]